MSNAPSTVLITGANRGIGLEFVRQYLDEGWQVFATCRSPQHAPALQSLAAQSARALRIVALDVTAADSVRHAAQTLQSEPIDLLLNCAGVMGGAGQTVGALDYAQWAELLAVNTLGPLRMLEAFVPHLEQGTGRLAVTLTSRMGSIGETGQGDWIAYRSSKAALNMAMKCAALALAARHVTCVVMHPGWVRTDMGGMQAPLSAPQSVTAMRRVIAGLGTGDSGKFFNYDGQQFPW